ncbi:hypothetical protein LJR153_007276 [Paenibacillus sp. LjRoot153]|uniref:hypothetical protein n=1 Tax=Paenibacillus sp. LjRoot153 TaxID=3342270 RepID=UPI003ECDCE2F
MARISFHNNQLDKLINMGAPSEIIENEKRILRRLLDHFDKRNEFVKEIISKFKEDGTKYAAHKIDEETAKEVGLEAGIVVIVSYASSQPKVPEMNILINFPKDINDIYITSESIPVFSDKMSENLQYKKLNEYNDKFPLIKVYKIGEKTRIASNINQDENVNLEIIFKRIADICMFIEIAAPQIIITNAIWEN